jgi:predicted PurR-regulated permease PerM
VSRHTGTAPPGVGAGTGDDPERTGLAGAPDPDADDPSTEEAAAARAEEEQLTDPQGDRAVPRGLQVCTAFAWRFLVLAAAAYVLVLVMARTQLVLVPVIVGLLLSALLQPLAGWLVRRGLPRALSSAIVLFGGLLGIGLLVWLVVAQFRGGLTDLTSQVEGGIDKIRDWLVNGPLGLSERQIDDTITSAEASLRDNQSTLTSGAIGAAATVGHIVTGLLIALFTTFFFIKDGRQIFGWAVRLFPAGTRGRVSGAGERAWHTLVSYVRATLAVAFVDAVGIGVGAAVLGVPLALPLGVIVFLGAFVPIIGATVSGLVAVLVALVAKGPVTALILLGIVLLVQQVEGHVLQPLLLGRAVSVHPLAVVLAIATGVLLAGIVGALVAVPFVAVANTIATYLSREGRTLVPTEPEGQVPT